DGADDDRDPFERSGFAPEDDLPERRTQRIDTDERDRRPGAHQLLSDAHTADADYYHQRAEEGRVEPLFASWESLAEHHQHEEETAACDYESCAEHEERPEFLQADSNGEVSC